MFSGGKRRFKTPVEIGKHGLIFSGILEIKSSIGRVLVPKAFAIVSAMIMGIAQIDP
jgi:hypothetical protein